ncbi:hypothetical protein SAMN05216388_101568 [Halorientalis persicus]|jgi:hypothetical protein|uniref:Uncharacterized protein n=1 Tax=Halorientalis persicus TaxID=1367881 RepID=A0A1H8R3D2_9EURY|nr:hypothetical protein [Halorientalis persicus]SEO60922.1 hypothetical protein SAMN05216388_101568 [Halorientalis persicus]
MSPEPRPIAFLRRYSLVLELLGTVTGLVAVWYLLDLDPIAMAGSAVGITAATVWPHVRRRFGINRGWGKVPLGLALIGLGAYALAFTGGNDVLKVAFLVVGAWLALDGVYDFRSEAGQTEPGAPDAMDRFGDASIVGRSLEERPKSITELDEALDLPRARIEDAVETLRDLDLIERDGERYTSRLDDRSLTDALRTERRRARERVGSLPERIGRPFRLFT